MLVDLAMVHYALALRVQGWIGDLAVRIEHEFFGDDAFTEVVKGQRRIADRFAVAERVQRLSEQLMPTLDRANRMMIRNLNCGRCKFPLSRLVAQNRSPSPIGRPAGSAP